MKVTKRKSAKEKTGTISLTSRFRTSSKELDAETIEVIIYNIAARYSVKEKMTLEDDPDEFAEFLISDNDLGIERTAENIGELANYLEGLWY